MNHGKFPDSLQQQISQLDQIWREWLFGGLAAEEAVHRAVLTERVFFELITDAENEVLESSMFLKARIEPYVSAMLLSIVEIRESGLKADNVFVRGSEFHKHLPPSSLVRHPQNGVLAVPFPGEMGPCI